MSIKKGISCWECCRGGLGLRYCLETNKCPNVKISKKLRKKLISLGWKI